MQASPRFRSFAVNPAVLAMTALVLASIVPLLLVEVPPLVDLLGHIGRYAIQTELAERPEIQPYFSYDWQLIGNLGADLLVQALHPLLGVEGSVRAIVIATQLLASSGILILSREVHGRITPSAVVALVLIYSFPFNFGFLNFVLAMALALHALALWMRLRRASETSAHVTLAIAGAVIWLCHAYGWAFLGLLCGSVALAEAVEQKRRPVDLVLYVLGRCWPLLLPLIPMLLWRADAAGSGAETGNWSLALKAQWTLSILRTRYEVLDLLSLLFVVGFGYAGVRRRSKAFDLRIGLAALFCLAAFLLLPVRVFGSYFADMRMGPYALMLALLAISPAGLSQKALRGFLLAAIAFFAGRMALVTHAYMQEDREIAAAMPTLAEVPEGSRVATFIVGQCGASWKLPVLWHVGGLSVARHNVFANDQWEQSGMNPLSVDLPGGGKYAHDASQVIFPDGCEGKDGRTLSFALNDFPREAFTHVWVLGNVPEDMPQDAGLVPLEHRGTGWLFAIRPSRHL